MNRSDADSDAVESQIHALLRSAHIIAVVGLSDDPTRPSYDVAQSLIRFGYRVVPVTPTIASWQGLPAYSSLETAVAGLAPGERIDIVDVFRRPQYVGAIVDSCIALKLPTIWLQLGVSNEPEERRAREAGVTVIANKCIKVERMRLG